MDAFITLKEEAEKACAQAALERPMVNQL